MRLFLRSSAVCSLLMILPACGDKSPTTPTAVTPTPTPTAQPSATPPPTSSPTLPQSCRSLAPSTGTPSGCRRDTGNFHTRVRDAVNSTYGAPYRDPVTGRTYEIVQGDGRILVASAYLKAVSDALDRQGVCALYDGEEIWVSDGGGYNEHYDLITAEGFSWVNYAVTCSPAIPMPRVPPPAPVRDAQCSSIPASSPIFCSKPPSSYDGAVWDAQDQLIAEDRARPTPQIFNFNVKLPNTDYGYLIVNTDRYIADLMPKIRAKGFCVVFDGEFVVKQNNVLSEHMDMIRADGFAIRSHISTCRDAAF